MKWILTALATAAPIAAAACEFGGRMGAGMGEQMGRCGVQGSCLTALSLAVSAALGYWVLHQSSKDSGATRWAGWIVGWSLTALGTAGIFCGAVSHISRALSGGGCPMTAESHMKMDEMQLPPGHPHVGGTTDKAAEPPKAPAKKGK